MCHSKNPRAERLVFSVVDKCGPRLDRQTPASKHQRSQFEHMAVRSPPESSPSEDIRAGAHSADPGAGAAASPPTNPGAQEWGFPAQSRNERTRRKPLNWNGALQHKARRSYSWHEPARESRPPKTRQPSRWCRGAGEAAGSIIEDLG